MSEGAPPESGAQLEPRRETLEEAAERREPIIVDPRTNQVLGTVSSFSWEQYYSGPLPTPQQLDQYNQVSPGLGDRIVTEWQTEGAHRRRLESSALRGQLMAQTRGQVFAVVLALVIVLGGIGLLYTDRPIEGLVAVIAPLATLAGVFLYSSRRSGGMGGAMPHDVDHEQLTRATGHRDAP